MSEEKILDHSQMPSDEVIQELKDKFKHLEAVQIAGDFYIYRRITRAEQKLLQEQILDNSALSDPDFNLVKASLVWPEPTKIDWEDKGAGVIATLAQNILKFSGFVPDVPAIKL